MLPKSVEAWEQARLKLQAIEPDAALKLLNFQAYRYQFYPVDSERFSLFDTQSKQWVVNDCILETQRWKNNLSLEGNEVFFLYGLGLGYQYLALKPWLAEKKTRQLVFFEDDLEILGWFLHLPWAAEFFDHPQVHFHWLPQEQVQSLIIPKVAWNYVLMNFEIKTLPFYEDVKTRAYQQLRSELSHALEQRELLASEFLRHAEDFYRNFYSNFLKIGRSRFGAKLFSKFQHIPIVICGAGPSLEEQIPELKELEYEALILAGGSAVNALSKADLLPHLGLGIDPNPLQEQRILSNQAYELPYFYRQRLYYKALEAIHGPKLFLNGSAGYPLSQWVEQQLNVEAPIVDEGHNVLNLALDVARSLGTEEIYLAGVDLAFSNNKVYADGVVKENTLKDKETSFLNEEVITWKGEEGKMVKTHWKWVDEARWIAHYIERQEGLHIYNCSKKGLKIDGAPFRELSQVKSPFQRDLKNRLWLEIASAAPLGFSTRQLRQTLEPVLNSLKRALGLCQELLAWCSEVVVCWQKTPQQPQERKLAMITLNEADLFEELAYRLVLQTMDSVHERILERKKYSAEKAFQKQARYQELVELALKIERYEFLQVGIEKNLKLMEEAGKESPRKEPVKRAPALKAKLEGSYRFDYGEIFIDDPILPWQYQAAFDPPLLPKRFIAGTKVEKGLEVKLLRYQDGGEEILEAWLEKEGEAQGQYQLFDRSGQVKGEAYLKAGKLHGPSRFYFEGGHLAAEGWFLEGVPVGRHVQYHQNKQIYSLCHYREGVLSGAAYYFFEEGSLKSELNYEKGKLKGTQKLYSASGILLREESL